MRPSKNRTGPFSQEVARRAGSGPRNPESDRPERARWRDLLQPLARKLDALYAKDGEGEPERPVFLLAFRAFLPLVDRRWWRAYPGGEIDELEPEIQDLLEQARGTGAETEGEEAEIGELRAAAADAIDLFARAEFPEGVRRSKDLVAALSPQDEPPSEASPERGGARRGTSPPPAAEIDPESRAFFDAVDSKIQRHLTVAELRSMRRRDRLHPREVAHLLRHLGTGCNRCWQAYDASLYPSGREKPTIDPTVLALRTLAAESVRELTGRHRGAVERARERPLGLAFLILEEARQAAHGAADLAPHLIEVLQLLLADPQLQAHDPWAYRDLRARTQAYLGLTHDLVGDLEAAGHALDRAEEELAFGSGDPELEGQVLYLRAAWLGDGRKFDQALETYCRAGELLEHVEPIDSAVEVLIQCATLLHQVYDQPGEARRLLEQGVQVMDAQPAGTNPLLCLGLRHELARAEMSVARDRGAAGEDVAPDFSAAAARLRELEPLYKRSTDRGVLDERQEMLAEIAAAERARLVN